MSEYRIKQDINLFEIVDEYTKRISRVIDEQTLANVENQLAEYGYVKVVRCKDCKFRCFDECTRIDEGFKDYWFAIDPDGFCAWAKRKEVD